MSEVLALDGVARRFGRRLVVRSASLHVNAGEITALLGRNGCGKTTVLRIACGVIPADSGHVRIGGELVVRPRLHQLASRGVLLLPERGLLTSTATVRAHFARMAARWGGDPAGAIAVTRIGEFLDRYAGQLSGGERRRVEFALALARRPALLLADEPFHGIAPLDAELLGDAIRHLRDAGCGVLITGHEVETLLDLAGRVVWMSAGTTHALGAPTDARAHHSFRMDYLGPPRGRPHG